MRKFTKKDFGRFLASRKIKIKDINKYLIAAYRIGINPLPALRDLLKTEFDDIQIRYGIWDGNTFFLTKEEGGPDLIVWVLINGQDIEDAWLEINN